MSYKIIIQNAKLFQKDLSKIDHKNLQKIDQTIMALGKNPFTPNIQIKRLQNYEIADFRVRVGAYRILFLRNDEIKEIRLIRVLHRSKLY